MKYAINMKQYYSSECISIEFSIPKAAGKSGNGIFVDFKLNKIGSGLAFLNFRWMIFITNPERTKMILHVVHWTF